MLSISSQRIYLYREPVHMNRSFEGLGVLVQSSFPGQLLTGSYFLFFNRQYNKIKILYWDLDGFVIFYKRLEKGRFSISKNGKPELSRREFQMLFEGIQPRSLNRRFSFKNK